MRHKNSSLGNTRFVKDAAKVDACALATDGLRGWFCRLLPVDFCSIPLLTAGAYKGAASHPAIGAEDVVVDEALCDGRHVVETVLLEKLHEQVLVVVALNQVPNRLGLANLGVLASEDALDCLVHVLFLWQAPRSHFLNFLL
jgi:hypothetical protein